jgi:DNA-binding IclR family transcriptional regulator
MSKTMLNRLAMLEQLDISGALTIGELARRSGLDVSVVSRTVSALEPDGWVVRVNNRVMIGPRATLLGRAGAFAEVMAAAAPLVHAIAGATGLASHAYGLIGTDTVALSGAVGRSHEKAAAASLGLAWKAPLHATAAGRAIAAQLDDDRLDKLLPSEPFPDAAAVIANTQGTAAEYFFPTEFGDAVAPTRLARNRSELMLQLEHVRKQGVAVDCGSLEPSIYCIAVPWPLPELPASLACIGSPEVIVANRELIVRVLSFAARPGATPEMILTAAATTLRAPDTPPAAVVDLVVGAG